MKTFQNMNLVNWQTRLTTNSKFLRRWVWYIALSMIVITLWTYFLPDLPSVTAYQATLQVNVILPIGLSDPGHVDQSTALFSSVFLSPDVLTLVIPRLQKLKPFSNLSLAQLQSLVTTSIVKKTPIVTLSALSDTPQDATLLVTSVYNALVAKVDSKRSPIIKGLNSALYSELTQVQDDAYNSSLALQNLKATGQNTTFQFYLLSKLHEEQQGEVNQINALLLAFSQEGAGPNNNYLQLVNSTPAIKTFPAAQPSYPLRLLLSPILGLIMGISGALLAERFSNRIPLRGKKRELVLPHIAAVIPEIADIRNRHIPALQQAYTFALPLLRRLRYQSSEHETRLKFITVTSPKGREGKSTVATMLAMAAAQSGLDTLLVDANPSRAVLHTWFHVPNENGMLTTLNALAAGTASLPPFQDTPSGKLHLLPIGKKDPTVRLQELRMDSLRMFIDLLGHQADLIIFDAPPLLTDANTTNLVMFSDVVLLIVDAKKSHGTAVVEAESLLANMQASCVTILNRAVREYVE